MKKKPPCTIKTTWFDEHREGRWVIKRGLQGGGGGPANTHQFKGSGNKGTATEIHILQRLTQERIRSVQRKVENTKKRETVAAESGSITPIIPAEQH